MEHFTRENFMREAPSDISGQLVEKVAELNHTMESFGPANRHTENNIGKRVTPQKLNKRGYGEIKDWRNTDEFSKDRFSGLKTQMNAVFEIAWGDRRVVDESLRVHFQNTINDSEDELTDLQKKELTDVLDGHFQLNNMRLQYDYCGGDTAAWVATTDKGGLLSGVESDRLSFVHLAQQIKDSPQIAIVMEKIDDLLIKFVAEKTVIVGAKIGPDGELIGGDEVNTTLEVLMKTLSDKELKLDGENVYKRGYIKEVALAWYKILGFPDIRKYGLRSQVYAEKMPGGTELRRNNSKEVDRYKSAVEHKSASIGLTPYFFLMDPNALMARVLNKYANIVDGIEIRTANSKSEHKIFNLGFRPPAWFFMDKINVTPDKPDGKHIKPLDLNNTSLSGLNFSKMTDAQWQKFIDDGGDKLLSDQAFKYAEKAIAARGAYYACLNAEPEQFGKVFVAVADFLRKNEEPGNIFTKAEVFPMVTEALIAIARWLRSETKARLPIEESKFRMIMMSIKGIVSPVDPFKGSDIEELIKQGIPSRGIL